MIKQGRPASINNTEQTSLPNISDFQLHSLINEASILM